ncbi:AI-2E family transporter [Iamia majanohamensis]|uniref:AI-2E family transporter n=1 Tax=Iamia majanohamensis TaxID=467976 RepID=A0AAF0BVZ5_9ACTN|nr:AI-2E family transporter [Iamia majanohamensis]WCO66864.1 AI-2E family transporter [Iamia majanohamensis]
MAAPPSPSWRPPSVVLKVTAWAGCTIVVLAAGWLFLKIASALALVLFPLVVTAFLSRILAPPSQWLRRRGWRPAPAAAATVVGFLVLLGGLTAAMAPSMVSEFRGLGDAVADGVADIEDWVVEDSGLDVTRQDIEEAKDDASDRASEVVRNSGDQIVSGARLVLTALVGLVLSLILTFFALKDGPDTLERAHRALPEHRRRDAEVVASASWASLGGYLRGAALLGLLEAVVIGATMAILGVDLILPVMLLTFLAAFVPLVGATVAGVLAVLVTLAAGGLVPALIVGVVALLVQQFDNDLLAPWIYGKALEMHPVVILLAITTGTAAFGVVGTFLAVPLTAVVLTSVKALRAERTDPTESAAAGGDGSDPPPSPQGGPVPEPT